jgi:hypothetical protein
VFEYQMVIDKVVPIRERPVFGKEPPYIWPHLPALLVRSSLRFTCACHQKSVPIDAMRRTGSEFSNA